MGFFDRFKSTKGKDRTAGPKRGVLKSATGKEAEQKAFAAVPAGKDAAPKAKEKTEKTAPQPSSSTAHLAHRVLRRPLVTEKSTRGGSGSQYTFEVAPAATKADVRQSVRHLYGIAPVAVNIIVLRGKVVRFGRTYGRTADRKKAIVTLPPGKTIDVVNA